MKLKSLFYIVAVPLVLLFSGCCKDKGPPDPVYIPQEMKDYMLFKVGTYWIYKEETSGVEDSVYVYDSYNAVDTFYDGGDISGIYEIFEIKTNSSHSGYNYYYNVDGSWIRKNRAFVKRIKTKPGDYVGETFVMEYPPIIGNVLSYYPNILSVVSFYETYSLIAVNFSSVIKMNGTRDVTENEQKVNYYFSPNFGIIKKELLDSMQTWNLDRCHIIQ